jgi:hypothetical protein
LSRLGLTGPEYSLFGANVELPSGLKDSSRHGPSTTDHRWEEV